MKNNILLSLLIILSLSGCSSIVSNYISRQQSLGNNNIASKDEILKLGFVEDKHCSSNEGLCISYLTADGLDASQELTYEAASHRIDIPLDKLSVELRSGTVVLLHGFRGSKELLINSALYFRFLGFDVLIPDLLGHGESDGDISFGIKDSKIINELLNDRSQLKYPLIILGNSMGAVAATHITKARSDVAGLVLQAPMLRLDDATVNYFSAYSSTVSRLLTESAMREGALKALKNSQVSVEDTDIKPILSKLTVPVLLFASTNDPVAPYNSFIELNEPHITLVEIHGRNHAGMGAISDDDHEKIDQWLNLNTIE